MRLSLYKCRKNKGEKRKPNPSHLAGFVKDTGLFLQNGQRMQRRLNYCRQAEGRFEKKNAALVAAFF
jgi:hypothetical protein